MLSSGLRALPAGCRTSRAEATPMDVCPSSGFSLLALPTDLLTTVLQQASIGARELCCLEACASALKNAIDESIWRTVFLHQRRPNALREPENWKQEFARRDSWSSGWRQLIASANMPIPNTRLGGHTQKLRRFALKIMSSVPISPSPKYMTHIVDPRGLQPGSHLTINDALSRAKPYDVVMLEPGTYHERLRIERPVEVVGRGPHGSCTIIGTDGPTIEASSRIACRIARVCIEQKAQNDGSAMSGAVLVKGGALMIVEECSVSSDTGHCIVVQGAESCGYILHNHVHHGKGVGVLVCDNAKGVIEDNVIACNGRAGIAILSGGDPLVMANKIHDGMDSGVLVSERGRGRIEENDIFGNRRAGVAILKEGAPLVKRNKIHDGRDSGVLVCENGKGSVVDNDIFANQMAGVAIGRGGASRITGNIIRDGNGGSLCLSAHSRGLISANVIHQDPRAAMQVPDGLMSEVKEHNLIRYATVDDGATYTETSPRASCSRSVTPQARCFSMPRSNALLV